MTHASRTANVLGALALTVTDQVTSAVTQATGLSPSQASVLSALHEFLDRPTVEQIRSVLGLTPSGAVRLIDRLESAGLVTREPGKDGRSRAVSMTGTGRRVATEIADARQRVLNSMLDGLASTELDTLHELLGRVMGGAVRAKQGGAWICRMCDLTACERQQGHCPAATAAAAIHGDAALYGVGPASPTV